MYKLGTVFYGPGKFLFYGLHICQDEDFTITVHADDKLNGLESFLIDITRSKQGNEVLNAI